jgi:hypothetical protein
MHRSSVLGFTLSDLEHFGEASNCNSLICDRICDRRYTENGFVSVAVLSGQCCERTGEKEGCKLIGTSRPPFQCE